ncbi:MAG: nucleotidyltransferase family protein [Lachnospiraceae bacterium]
MGHIGIVAEYNPFHNGHYYQINKVKADFPDKEIVVIMSGNYVQRGEPAIFNKYIRTKMALAGGADMVIELPPCFASQSAEIFARSAVLSLFKTGTIDTLCFGAESTNHQLLQQIADVLNKEPFEYTAKLQNYLSKGLSFPKARSLSLSEYLDNNEIKDILSKPNNILAIEYLKAIKYYQLPITPYIIERSKDNYHDDQLPFTMEHSENGLLDNNICSATALRKDITNQKISRYIPERSYHQFINEPFNKPLFINDFYPFLQNCLLQESDFSSYQDISGDFANKLSKYDILPFHIDSLFDDLASKNMTNTRINRCLIHILLQFKKNDMEKLQSQEYALYLRVLGFRKNSALPKLIKEHASIPIITKVANYNKQLNGFAASLFEQQIKADNYYRQVYFNKYQEKIPSEYEHSVIIYETD